MANEQNLKPQNLRTKSEQREIARQGGIKSGEARREKKLIKERILEKMGEDDWDAYITGIIERAKDSRADAEFLRDTIGQKPVDKTLQTNIDAEYVASVEFINKLMGEDL